MATGFAGKRGLGWVLLASWLIPVLMTLAYIILMATSETDNTGKAWESVGLGFVFVLWYLFRLLTSTAAITRAVVVADADRVLELADRELGKRWRAATRAPFHGYRAIAFELRGDWSSALAALDHPDMAKAPARTRVLAATVRVGALAETGNAADAHAAYDAALTGRVPDPQLVPLVRLAEARMRWADGKLDEAEPLLARLVDDVRAGVGTRGVAHYYLARIADARGDAAAARRHRQRAKELAPNTWVAG